jgi:predicted  nucleic acid-binding Zn-ribbon protein
MTQELETPSESFKKIPINLESFGTLKEIYSLEQKIQGHLKLIDEQNSRVKSLSEQMDSTVSQKMKVEEELKLLKELNVKDDRQLQGHIEKMNSLKSRQPNLKTEQEIKATANEIEHLAVTVGQLEAKVFKQLEKCEQYQVEIKKFIQFSSGLEKTIKDIQSEVDVNVDQEKQQIKNYEMRIQNLKENCSRQLIQRYVDLRKQSQKLPPLAFIVENHCSVCKILISRRDQSNIERAEALETCPSCQRILLPSSLI